VTDSQSWQEKGGNHCQTGKSETSWFTRTFHGTLVGNVNQFCTT